MVKIIDIKLDSKDVIVTIIFSLFILSNIIALAIPPYSNIHFSFWICPSINIGFFVSLIILLLSAYVPEEELNDNVKACMVCPFLMFGFGFLLVVLLFVPLLFKSSEVEGMSSDSKFEYFFDKYNFKFINLMFYPFLTALLIVIILLGSVFRLFTKHLLTIYGLCCYTVNEERNNSQNESVTSQPKDIEPEYDNTTSQPKDIEPPEYDNTSPPEYTV
jgi:hypothetical protein